MSALEVNFYILYPYTSCQIDNRVRPNIGKVFHTSGKLGYGSQSVYAVKAFIAALELCTQVNSESVLIASSLDENV